MLDEEEGKARMKKGRKEWRDKGKSSRFTEGLLGGRKCINIILFDSHNHLRKLISLSLSQRALLKLVQIVKSMIQTKSG